MQPSKAIEAHDLGVMRGERVLFQGVTFGAEPGEAVVLRGANGAGKTTLLRCLAGFVRPDAGSARAGVFHWLGHAHGIKSHETPLGHLRHWARAWGSDRQVEAILEQMSLDRVAKVNARGLSAGQKRRLAFGRLLLKERPVWLLDEPFAAVDTDGQGLIAHLISDHLRTDGAVCAAVHGSVPIKADLEISL